MLSSLYSFTVENHIVFRFNPLSPNIKIQILHTDLYTFPLRISWENLIKDQGIFSLVIILLILIASSLNNIWILLGENWSWSLLVLKGLTLLLVTSAFSLTINLPFVGSFFMIIKKTLSLCAGWRNKPPKVKPENLYLCEHKKKRFKLHFCPLDSCPHYYM